MAEAEAEAEAEGASEKIAAPQHHQQAELGASQAEAQSRPQAVR